ncbi:MAG: hypothetical protein IKX58_00945 [Clostridia bacterium]|nr:hypothetical protein [Clostridia bacterium]
MPLIPIIIIVVAILSAVSNQNKKQQQQSRRTYNPKQAGMPPVTRQEISEAERQARQEELKRRLLENKARREAEAASQLVKPKPAQSSKPAPAKQTERRPLEKQTLEKTIRSEKPIAEHPDEECGGGSIHDGYHEGVTQFTPDRPVAVAGRLGHRLADEDDMLEKEKLSAENARRAMARIAKLPPLAQGMIYSEILGKPKSETA